MLPARGAPISSIATARAGRLPFPEAADAVGVTSRNGLLRTLSLEKPRRGEERTALSARTALQHGNTRKIRPASSDSRRSIKEPSESAYVSAFDSAYSPTPTRPPGWYADEKQNTSDALKTLLALFQSWKDHYPAEILERCRMDQCGQLRCPECSLAGLDNVLMEPRGRPMVECQAGHRFDR